VGTKEGPSKRASEELEIYSNKGEKHNGAVVKFIPHDGGRTKRAKAFRLIGSMERKKTKEG